MCSGLSPEVTFLDENRQRQSLSCLILIEFQQPAPTATVPSIPNVAVGAIPWRNGDNAQGLFVSPSQTPKRRPQWRLRRWCLPYRLGEHNRTSGTEGGPRSGY